MNRKIYLSAPAIACCAGINRNELYESCLNAYQGGFIMRELPAKGKQVPVGIIPVEMPEVIVPEPLAFTGKTRIIRIINTAMEQLRPLVEQAIARYGSDKIGICLGSCDNGSEALFLVQHVLFTKDPYFQSASCSAEFIASSFGINGPAFTVATACASGASAIARGAELIQAGICDAVIAGGADTVTDSVLAGFSALEALSDDLSIPFSKNRKGFNLGEGAAFFLLDSQKNSGVELMGVGESSDAHHMTAPSADGAGPAQAMNAAIRDARIDSGQIGYINFHGTGTVLNDRAEFLAMQKVFGTDRPFPPCGSTKPITGHTMGAAGALEAGICWMVLHEQRGLPVHCWDGVADEELPFSPVSRNNREAPSICMSNNFGFGGCNVSLILGRSD